MGSVGAHHVPIGKVLSADSDGTCSTSSAVTFAAVRFRLRQDAAGGDSDVTSTGSSGGGTPPDGPPGDPADWDESALPRGGRGTHELHQLHPHLQLQKEERDSDHLKPDCESPHDGGRKTIGGNNKGTTREQEAQESRQQHGTREGRQHLLTQQQQDSCHLEDVETGASRSLAIPPSGESNGGSTDGDESQVNLGPDRFRQKQGQGSPPGKLGRHQGGMHHRQQRQKIQGQILCGLARAKDFAGSLPFDVLTHLKPMVVRPLPSAALSFEESQAAFFAEYELGKVLGYGSYGVVQLCTHKRTSKMFACKVVEKAKLAREKDVVRARLEFVTQKRVSGHKHVVQAEDFFEGQESMYLVMARCAGGDLYDLVTGVKQLEEEQAAALFLQLLSAVRHCHNHEVLHRDLKLENVLVADRKWGKRSSASGDLRVALATVPTVKLADFGTAVFLPKGEKTSGRTGGSFMYQAPEVLQCKKYDYKADMWALGVILFTLLSGAFPFTAPKESMLVGMIKRGAYRMAGPVWGSVSAEAKDVVRRLLEYDPEKRASVREISAHPWVVQHTGHARAQLPRTLTAHG